MAPKVFAWVVFGLYVVTTTALAIRGMRKTTSLASFAIGGGRMGPVMVGITLAAAVSSTATFVINPGFVYANGVSALFHFGVAGYGGVLFGLVVLSKGFRTIGGRYSALTLPHWLGARYESPALRTYFALLNLILAVTFCVLIVKGSALVMQHTLGLGYATSVVVIVSFVFTYITIGGSFAHAYIGVVQGAIMALVALAVFASGLPLLFDSPGVFERLASQDPALVATIHPDSPLFGSVWQVFVCGFIVSYGLVCQPHILTKSLYLESDRDLPRYLIVSGVVGSTFALMLVVGLWARVLFPGIESQDAVIAVYIEKAFTPYLGTFVSLALLSAGMSTMDGLLVGASSIVGNDLFLGLLGERLMPDASREARERKALLASRGILVVMGAAALILSLNPPQLVGLFAQMGVYGLVAASAVPMTAGIFLARPSRTAAAAAAVIGPAVHFAHYIYVFYGRGEFINPAVTATEGVIASALAYGLGTWVDARQGSPDRAPP